MHIDTFLKLNQTRNISSTEAVRNYVVQHCSANRHPQTRSTIVKLLQEQPPLAHEKILYRGVRENFPKNILRFKPYCPTDFFSTSQNEFATTSFLSTEEDCCLLEIRVQPGVRVLDVNAYLGAHAVNFPEQFKYEEEWLVEGGGCFFANPERTRSGFMAGEFEGYYITYYFPPEFKGGSKARKTRKSRKAHKSRKSRKTNLKRKL